MYRILPVSRRVTSSFKVVRRRFTTGQPIQPPKRKKSLLRRIIVTTTVTIGTFYAGSTFAAFHNQTYYNLFSENVPLAQSCLEYGENHGWDTLTPEDVLKAGSNAVTSSYQFVKDTISGTTPPPAKKVDSVKQAVEQKTAEAKATTFKVLKKTTEKVDSGLQQGKELAQQATQRAADKVQSTTDKVVYTTEELIKRAEAAVAGKPFVPISNPPSAAVMEKHLPETSPETSSDPKTVYTAPLPLGFEPPPGFTRPSPSKPKPKQVEQTAAQIEVVLPLVAPSVASAPEPIISHLAGTIDNLASYLKSDPKAAAKAGDVLETAKSDLTALVERMEVVKEQERRSLEAKLDEQTREYTLKLIELEMEAQDKLDHQEHDFKEFFEQERAKFIQAYRQKLDHELQVQTELINERLKEEVIAQGIELQRRWIREIKVRVEQERGGRLAKLDELSANLKRLEQITLDNSAYLDENIRVHTLWTAYRALSNTAISSNERRPFREELRVLRHITAAREDPIVSVVLDSLEKTDTPDIGVEPLPDLASWFVNEVAPKVSQVALVPDENAGVLSYLASRALSSLRFKRQGLVPGNDVLSVLARAEYFLSEKNLDSAARELNQLKGPAKVLLHDWLEAARRRLEVQQALEVVQTQASLASLLVVQ